MHAMYSSSGRDAFVCMKARGFPPRLLLSSCSQTDLLFPGCVIKAVVVALTAGKFMLLSVASEQQAFPVTVTTEVNVPQCMKGVRRS